MLPKLIVIDEASRVSDEIRGAIIPMLLNGGRLVALTTPHGKVGWFYEAWQSSDPSWERLNAKAEDSPRVSPEALAEQRVTLGERVYSARIPKLIPRGLGRCFHRGRNRADARA